MAIRERAITDVEVNGQNASTVLDQLTRKASGYRKAMTEANKANDLTGYKKAETELKKTERTMKQLRKATFDVNNVMRNLSTTSMADLTRAQRQLQAELKKTTRGTTEYVRKSKQLGLVSNELSKVRREMRGVSGSQQGMLNRMANGFNRFGGMALGIVASLTGLGLTFRKLANDADEYQQKVANLSALTGLVGDDLDWLSNKAKDLSTSTTEDGIRITKSADEIVEAFTLMGSAKPELLENKDALAAVTTEALKLAEAAQMDTKTAVESLGNVMNQFGAGAEQASKYINVLAAGSKAGAAAVDSIANSIVRFGPAAASANVSVEESVALIETLAEKGVKGERAGTALRTALLKLQTGTDEFNPKVVGLNKALENMSEANLSAGELVKLFGQEAYTAGAILVENVDRVKHFTDAVTDTNIATEQAIKNTETEKALRQQAINQFKLLSMELGQKLSPVLRHVTLTGGTLVKVIMALVNWGQKYGKTVLVLSAAIAGYSLAINATTIAKKIMTVATNIANAAMKAFNATTKMSPVGMLVGLLSAAAMAFAVFRKKADDAAEGQKKVNEMVKEFDELMEDSKSIEERMATLEKLNKRQLEGLKDNIQQQIHAHEDFEAKLEKIRERQLKRAKDFRDSSLEVEGLNDEQKKQINDRYEYQVNSINKAYDEQVATQQKSIDKLNEYTEQVKNVYNSIKDDVVKKTYDELLEALEEYNRQRRLAIHKDYLQGIINKEEFDSSLQVSEIAHLEAMLALRRRFGEDTYDLDLKLTQERIKLAESVRKANQQVLDQIIQDTETNSEKLLEGSEKTSEEAIKKEFDLADAELDIWREKYEEKKGMESDALEHQKQMAEQYKALTDNLAASLGDLLGRMATDAEMTAQEVAKNLLLIALDAAHATARIAIAEIWAKSLASAESVATFGAAGVIKATAISAIVEMAFAGLKAAAPNIGQRQHGKYDVIGQEDGRQYNNVPYQGSMKTGMYTKPTLVAERGDELVVDNKTLRNVRINFPDVLPKIRASLVPQRAQGNVAQMTTDHRLPPTDHHPPTTDYNLVAAIETLNRHLAKGIDAKMLYGHWRDQIRKAEDIENRVSRS